MGAVGGIVQMGIGLASFIGAQGQAEAIRKKGQGEALINLENAGLADAQADDAISRGFDTTKKIRDYGDDVMGEQAAGFAAQGIDVTRGGAAGVQARTRQLVEQDVMTAKNNAWREAWGFRTQAKNYRTAAQYGVEAANASASSTLLAGGLGAANQFVGGAYQLYKG